MTDLFDTKRLYIPQWIQAGLPCPVGECGSRVRLQIAGRFGTMLDNLRGLRSVRGEITILQTCETHARSLIYSLNPEAVCRCPNCGTIFGATDGIP